MGLLHGSSPIILPKIAALTKDNNVIIVFAESSTAAEAQTYIDIFKKFVF